MNGRWAIYAKFLYLFKFLIKIIGIGGGFVHKRSMTNSDKLSFMLADAKTLLTEEKTSLGHLMVLFGDRGTAFILFLVALPAALPVPATGFFILVAPPLLFITAQLIFGRKTIWLPEEIKEKNFKTASLIGFIDKSIPWVQRMEIFIKPRLTGLTNTLATCVIGAMGFIMALSVLMPLPLTNTVPSFGIAMMAIGVLMRDGLAVIFGAVIGLGWVFMLTAALIYFGGEAIDIIKGFFHSLG
jgi:hypothetical protein